MGKVLSCVFCSSGYKHWVLKDVKLGMKRKIILIRLSQITVPVFLIFVILYLY